MKNSRVLKQKKFELLESISRGRSLPVTVQRRVVLDALLDRRDHPTVDQLYEDVRQRMPGVSRTTIYRALETLVELGLARRTHHFEATARFDGNTDHHHHLVCRRCGRVEDIEQSGLSTITLPGPGGLGFEIMDYSIHFEGLCSDCQKRAANSRAKKTRTKSPKTTL